MWSKRKHCLQIVSKLGEKQTFEKQNHLGIQTKRSSKSNWCTKNLVTTRLTPLDFFLRRPYGDFSQGPHVEVAFLHLELRWLGKQGTNEPTVSSERDLLRLKPKSTKQRYSIIHLYLYIIIYIYIFKIQVHMCMCACVLAPGTCAFVCTSIQTCAHQNIHLQIGMWTLAQANKRLPIMLVEIHKKANQTESNVTMSPF